MLKIELQNHRLLLTTSDDQTIGLDTLALSDVGRNVLAQFVLEVDAAFLDLRLAQLDDDRD